VAQVLEFGKNAAPEGRSRLAQRFSAGVAGEADRVPEGWPRLPLLRGTILNPRRTSRVARNLNKQNA